MLVVCPSMLLIWIGGFWVDCLRFPGFWCGWICEFMRWVGYFSGVVCVWGRTFVGLWAGFVIGSLGILLFVDVMFDVVLLTVLDSVFAVWFVFG